MAKHTHTNSGDLRAKHAEVSERLETLKDKARTIAAESKASKARLAELRKKLADQFGEDTVAGCDTAAKLEEKARLLAKRATAKSNTILDKLAGELEELEADLNAALGVEA